MTPPPPPPPPKKKKQPQTCFQSLKACLFNFKTASACWIQSDPVVWIKFNVNELSINKSNSNFKKKRFSVNIEYLLECAYFARQLFSVRDAHSRPLKILCFVNIFHLFLSILIITFTKWQFIQT